MLYDQVYDLRVKNNYLTPNKISYEDDFGYSYCIAFPLPTVLTKAHATRANLYLHLNWGVILCLLPEKIKFRQIEVYSSIGIWCNYISIICPKSKIKLVEDMIEIKIS